MSLQSLQIFTAYSRSPNLTLPKHPNYNRRFPVTVFPKLTVKATSSPSSSSSSDLDPSSSPVLVSGNGAGGVLSAATQAAVTYAPVVVSDSSSIEGDAVKEAELKENGFRSTRRTKLICTIGPTTCGFEQLEALAVGGMNVARINMCHGTRQWHRSVNERVRRLNEEKGFAVAIMMDTEGSEIHMGDLGGAPSVKAEVKIFPYFLIFFFGYMVMI